MGGPPGQPDFFNGAIGLETELDPPTLMDALLGLDTSDTPLAGRLGADVPANDERQDYLRAQLAEGVDGSMIALPFAKQDSSLLRRLMDSDCLVIRPPNAPKAFKGQTVEFLKLDF